MLMTSNRLSVYFPLYPYTFQLTFARNSEEEISFTNRNGVRNTVKFFIDTIYFDNYLKMQLLLYLCYKNNLCFLENLHLELIWIYT